MMGKNEAFQSRTRMRETTHSMNPNAVAWKE
jgi:hypothetical protein